MHFLELSFIHGFEFNSEQFAPQFKIACTLTLRTPEVRSRNYWNSAIKKTKQMANIELWTLKQEMETDDDHANMRERFSSV